MDAFDCRLETRESRPPLSALPVVCIGLPLEAGVTPAVALRLSRLRRPSDVSEGLLPTLWGWKFALYPADRDTGGTGYVTPAGTGDVA